MDNRRRLLIAVLFVATLVVGAAAVYIGLQLQQQPDITPKTIAAATCCDNLCQNPGSQGICGCCGFTDNKCLYHKFPNGDCYNDYTPGQEWMCDSWTSSPGSVSYGCEANYYTDPGCTNSNGSSSCSSFVTCNLGQSWCGGGPPPPPPPPPVTTPPPPPPPPPVTNTPTPTRRPTPTPTSTNPVCSGNCDPTPDSPSDSCPTNPPHTCVPDNGNQNDGTCKLTACVTDPALCYPNGCTIKPECGETCDPAVGTSACFTDHVCRDKDGDGTFTCILTICDTNPDQCQPGFCEVQQAFDITKSGNQACSTNPSRATVTYSVVITNPEATARTVDVTDTLDSAIQESYVIQTSITFGGLLQSGKIVWNDINVPANSTVTLNYQVVFPQSAYSVSYRNEVVVTEGTTERGRDSFTITPFCSPDTALISDTADRILIAVILIIVGMLMYRLKLYSEIGNLFWDRSGEKLLKSVKEINVKRRKQQKSKFEDKVEKGFDDEK